MNLDVQEVRDYLKNFQLEELFTQQLGWDHYSAQLAIQLDGRNFSLRGLADKRGVQIFECPPDGDGNIPDYNTRRKIEKQVTKSAYEHLIIFTDADKTTQIWQWVARQPGQPAAYREHPYHPQHQSGEALIQKLNAITIPLDEEEALDLTGTVHKLRDAFDRDRVTKRFYDNFKQEHGAFLKFINGITDQGDQEWYASLMLNRLMFVYFIQKKGFLDSDTDYLNNRLRLVQSRKGKGKFLSFYRYFLICLFHEGFSKQPDFRDVSPDLAELLGTVPYLNGGLFELHDLEQKHDKIDIPDEAFERLFAFFDGWDWVLDTRPISDQKEINPEVLGYIFEKYINQKQMGAYYTKEDITEYISKNTIVPYVFDAAQKKCAIAFEPDSAVWRLLKDDPDLYIYAAVRKGVIDGEGKVILLPKGIAAGVEDVSKRDGWNRAAEADFALPSETWREHVARHQRCLDLRKKLKAGDVHEINDLITCNLDIRQFAEDAIENCEGPELLRAFYHAISTVTVLDPTCGSGAFLFAALNILEPLYETCLDRMQAFVDDLDRSAEKHDPRKFYDFRRTLAEIERHPNRTYFILKSIIVNNLYGVDIMEEAVEICKLRLFLKLVSQVERVEALEPLPDIDFNIRPGNTLVGFTTLDEVRRAITHFGGGQKKLIDSDDEATLARINEDAEIVERAFQKFHEMQTRHDMDARQFAEQKGELRTRLNMLAEELNKYTASEYGKAADKTEFATWCANHQPFHWFAEFYGIMRSGGFDVIVGNPPYVEYTKVRKTYTVRDYQTQNCGNLYAFMLERCRDLIAKLGRTGLVVPLSLLCTDRMASVRRLLAGRKAWLPAFDMRPSSLFEGVAQRLCIVIQSAMPSEQTSVFSGGYRRWSAAERPALLAQACFAPATWSGGDAPILKAAMPIELKIYDKISGPSVEQIVDDRAKPIYVHRICRYFIKAFDFVPHFRDADGVKGKSEDYKPFHFDPAHRAHVLSLLNSSLFYWFWRTAGDGFHCGYGDVYRMPFKGKCSDDVAKELSDLVGKLTRSMKSGSQRKSVTTKRGKIEYEEFYPASSKSIIDEIDATLARNYGFTGEELDFVINYDIKYRIGRDDEGD